MYDFATEAWAGTDFHGIEDFITTVQRYRQTIIDYFYDKKGFFFPGNGSLLTKETSIGAIYHGFLIVGEICGMAYSTPAAILRAYCSSTLCCL